MIFISGHLERSEGSPILGRGKRPLPNRPEVSSRTPFVRDLRLSPKVKILLGGVGGGLVHLLDLRRRSLRTTFLGDNAHF